MHYGMSAMDETSSFDPDCAIRVEALHAAIWRLNTNGESSVALDSLLGDANAILHFLTDGEGVEFSGPESLRKFVRGK
jgi:hypothetical protein